MAVHRGVPVITAAKRGGQFSRRRHVRITIKYVRDFVGVLLVHAGQGELREPLRCFLVERRGRSFIRGGRYLSKKCGRNRHQTDRGDLALSHALILLGLPVQLAFGNWDLPITLPSLMRSAHLLTLSALLSAFQVVSAADSTTNPLLKESALPFHFPQFDKIKNSDFKPAMEAGMREQLKEIEPIANNSAKPTFDNTIVALEKTGRLPDRAERTFDNLNACNTNPDMQKVDKEMAPKLSAHRDTIHLNAKLFARVKELYDNREKLGLDPESAYLLERYYKDFVRAGAKLSDTDKEKLKQINAELATLQTQ